MSEENANNSEPQNTEHYVLIHQENEPNLAICYPDENAANTALTEEPLVNKLRDKGCTNIEVAQNLPENGDWELIELITEERTVAFLSDPRAATLLLKETVKRLITTQQIERGLIDMTSLPGLAVAAAFLEADIPYEEIKFDTAGEPKQLRKLRRRMARKSPVLAKAFEEPTELADPVQQALIESAEGLRSMAVAVRKIALNKIAELNANLVLLPAPASAESPEFDFAPNTLPGIALEQLEAKRLPFILIVPPERGVMPMGDGTYARMIMHVAPPSEPEPTTIG